MATVALTPPEPDSSALLDQLATGIAIVDGEDRLVFANAAFVELCGLVSWRGRPLAVLDAAAAQLQHALLRARAAGTAVALRDWEITALHGSVRADLQVTPLDAAHLLLECHALGPHRRLPAGERLSQSLRGLAHEVKNPLAGLRGAAQLLEQRAPAEEYRRLAQLIIREADRLAVMADRLLHGGGKPHLATLNLHEVTERVLSLAALEADPRVRLERDYDPSLPALRGDADRLLQLLLNLLRNALQAGAKRIVLRTRAEHAVLADGEPSRLAACLDVVDDGYGVPDALRADIFMPLVSGRADGIGLGLALAREIAHEHGGRLSCHAAVTGTRMRLVLPLEPRHG